MVIWVADMGSSGAISFPIAPGPLMISSMDGTILPPELETYATEAVASGRYRSRNEVIAAGLSLLREADAEVASVVGSLDAADLAAFAASLDVAEAEGERLGFRSIDDVMRDADMMLDELDRRRG